jgi:hypothetical protein
MFRYDDVKQLIGKYAYSISLNVDYYLTNEDVYQELVCVYLHVKEKFPEWNKGQMIAGLQLAFRRKKMDIIKKYENEKFKNKLADKTQSYTSPALSQINLDLTINKIKTDINRHCLGKDRLGRTWRLHQAEQYHYILNSLLAGFTPPEIRSYMNMNEVTFKKRMSFLRKLCRKYCEPAMKYIFAHFNAETLCKIRASLKTKRIRDVAIEFNCAPSAIAHYISENNIKDHKRGYINQTCARPMATEIKALIKRSKPKKNLAIWAKDIKDKMETMFGYEDTFSRYYHLVCNYAKTTH